MNVRDLFEENYLYYKVNGNDLGLRSEVYTAIHFDRVTEEVMAVTYGMAIYKGIVYGHTI